MTTPPPFSINEQLIGPEGEEVTVLGFEEITDEEIRNWYISDPIFRKYGTSLPEHMKSNRELFPSGWSMVVGRCGTPYLKRANPWEYYRAEERDNLPCVLV
jgi:hypothetical protein